ncbi:MAG TPA: hypothetical protein VGS23_04225 [Thermoplasmata archaeon]|nr:hypothetical protein [Thermoplasmata archaeon]
MSAAQEEAARQVEAFREAHGDAGLRKALAALRYLHDHPEGASEETLLRIIEETP